MQNRIIPLDDCFMRDKKAHDIVWAWLQVNSTLRDSDKLRFVYCERSKNAQYEKIYNAIGQKISKNTIANTLKLYENTDMITYSTIKDIKGKDTKIIILSQNFERFQYIPLRLLQYFVNTANDNVIKVYAYLLGRYQWKTKENTNYMFTLTEIVEAIGYNPKTKGNTKMIDDILTSLQLQGLIEYKTTYILVKDNTIPSIRHILKNVSLEVNKQDKKEDAKQGFCF